MPTFATLSGSCRFSLSALAACLVLWAQPASAQQGSFSYPPQAASVEGNAVIGHTVALPNVGTPSFFINFVLPRDYKNNGDVRIVLYLSTPGTPCQVRLAADQLLRKRIGSALVNNITGLTGGNPVVNMAAGVLGGKAFALRPGGPLAGQRRGDGFTVEFTRFADHASDTCPSFLHVQGIDIRYAIP